VEKGHCIKIVDSSVHVGSCGSYLGCAWNSLPTATVYLRERISARMPAIMSAPPPVLGHPPDLEAYRDWHIPFSKDQITLREAHASLTSLGAKQEEIPLIIQVVENPRFHVPGINFFHGAVDLNTHDYIHILLGRGLLPEDEAFVIGFTMGTTHRVTTLEENLYALASKYFYPKSFQFRDADICIFKNATKLGHVSDCQSLEGIEYAKYLDWKLHDIRLSIGLESDLLLAYYRIEMKRYPQYKGTQRLLR
jgi:hypothetical protein